MPCGGRRSCLSPAPTGPGPGTLRCFSQMAAFCGGGPGRARLAMPGLPEVAYTDLTTPDLRAAGCFAVRAVLFCDAPALNGPGAEFAEPFVLA